MNDDVWESAFSPRLPMGIRDRLEDCEIRLDSLDQRAVIDLLKSRDDEKGEQIFKRLELESAEFYPRAVLRRAREIWEKIEDGSTDDQTASPATDSPKIGFAKVSESHRPAPSGQEDTFQKSSPYPPKPVRRVGLPRKFDVERIREKPELAMPAIASPFKIAVTPATVSKLDPKPVPPQLPPQPPPLPNWQEQAETKPAQNPFAPQKSSTPVSPEEPTEKAKSISDLLRQFRDKRDF